MSKDKMEESQDKISLINPSTIKTFLDEALSGGGTWQMLKPKDAELHLRESSA